MLNAIKVDYNNVDLVIAHIVKDAPWFADFGNIFALNASKGEWTYVYTQIRGTGANAKTMYYHMTESSFNETFTPGKLMYPFKLSPITVK